MSDPKSGSVSIADGVLTYRSEHCGTWSIHLSEVRKIEEFTSSDGPWLDDYFYCFHTVSKEEVSASFYAEGWSAVWPELEQVFPGLGQAGLCDSTSCRTRILWPQGTEKEANQSVEAMQAVARTARLT